LGKLELNDFGEDIEKHKLFQTIIKSRENKNCRWPVPPILKSKIIY